MQQIRYSPEDEQALMVQLWSPQIADNPESFVLFAFPWGQVGTPLEKFTGPRKWQRRVLRRMAEHIKNNRGVEEAAMEALQMARVSGRGIGKSALVSWLILWMMTTRIGGSVIVSANTESQLRTVTWGELTKWATMAINSHWWEVSGIKLTPAKWLSELVERDLKKGTRYWAAEGKLWSEENPDGYAGAHNTDGMMVIFDEASGIPDAIWSVAAGFFTEMILDRYFLAFSNGRRNTGAFFECFNAMRAFWETEQIDARTVEGTDKKVYQRIIDTYGEDSYEARVEVYGEFPESGDEQFISNRLVDDAMKRTPYKDQSAPIIMGVDPARGGDKTVVAVRQGRDIIAIERDGNADTMLVVGFVIDMIEKYKPALVVIDEGGVGAGVLDRLKEQRYKVRGVNFGWASRTPAAYINKRAEMWGMMKEWLKTAYLPTDKLLKTDLTGPNRETDSAGALQLESKKKMRARGVASPDSGDAIAETFAYPVAYRDETAMQKRIKQSTMNGNIPNSWMGA